MFIPPAVSLNFISNDLLLTSESLSSPKAKERSTLCYQRASDWAQLLPNVKDNLRRHYPLVIGKEQEEEGESFGLGRMSDDGANPHNTTGRKYASFIR